MIDIYSPLSGTTIALKDVEDPVLAGGIVGAGCAVRPVETRMHEVCAPVSGKLLKVHPHAFIIFTAAGVGVLCHLGIDTVKLHGEGFEVLRTEGDVVEAGDAVIRWDSSVAKAHHLSTSVSVIACDLPESMIQMRSTIGTEIQSRDLLFQIHNGESA
ncbi:PTS glucose transporter subunit IIA [Gleimia hominis]|uniref:PTS glucose transporter subunit IIA n=1 Tax=Gleimia hominis TaxID=595468 RepID=A0ABU3IAS1_9ACTO|nr:PTS glucose transporter subunit IIA [Gleimia hominis]MDT3767446.1 PTS glucose transporter subunit IIA [Gleimia hominis]